MDAKSIYDIEVVDALGNAVKISDYKGFVMLVVNVASECGFTGQYDELEELYQKYKDQKFIILGFPCNQFGGQEPGTEEEILSFCRENYGVTFPIMHKIDVNGDLTSPFYEYLKSKKSQLMMSRIKWNFEKFLISREGEVVDRYSSLASPQSISKDIEKLLGPKT